MNNFILKKELNDELEHRILPFWSALIDDANGGFYGFCDFHGKVDKRADKGSILQSRILWFFSALYKTKKLPQALDCANHAYKFIAQKCCDAKNGGLYWSVSYDGKPADDRKHVYTQSFAIYALSEYYKASKNQAALSLAMKLYSLIESKGRDKCGYLEEFDREWHEKDNVMLSEHGVISQRTMNTNLHLIEAYTNLYLACGDEKVKNSLKGLLSTIEDKIYNADKNTLKVFFDREWNESLDIRSYGHEIEASWLIDRATEAIGEKHLPLTLKIADTILRNFYAPDGLINETVNGVTDRHRVWWVQCESVIGFFNAYKKTQDKAFLDAAYNIWHYISENFFDDVSGEWYSEIDEKGRVLEIPVVSEWKCPYHNGRMCMEVIKMIDGESSFEQSKQYVLDRYNAVTSSKNHIADFYNGIFARYENPVLTRESIPPLWRYDFNEKTNPYFEERMGVNTVFNPGAIEFGGKFCLVARVEGSDRKSFFAVAESDSGVDGFKFRGMPIELPKSGEIETNVYDMRLTRHEDGWIYGIYCAEKKDPDAPEGNLSSAVAQAAIVRTHDLVTWERLPYLKTPSPQQRNVVLHPEFVKGKYCFYTRPMDGFIDTGSGSGICIGYCDDIKKPVIEKETVISKRRYHTITESKNGEGCVPIKTPKGWLHIAHGVRETAAGLRYVIYCYVTALDDVEKVIAEPGGYLIAPSGAERIGDTSNVVFTNGAICCENGDIYIYYASSDTRAHVATTTVSRLLDYAFNTPADPLTSADCVLQRIELIKRNLSLK